MKSSSIYDEYKLDIYGIKLKVIKKRIKNAYIYVKPPDGEVLLTAPKRMSMAEIEKFVLSKRDWIIKNQNKIKSRPQPMSHELKDGEVIYVWGKPYIIKIYENTGKNGFDISEIFVNLRFRNFCDAQIKGKLIRSMYASLLKEKISERLPVWEERTGLRCSSWGVRYMTTRWGSCNYLTNKLLFSTQLALKDPKFTDYVILHELAHTKVPSHGDDFKAILNQYMDDWKDKRRELNK